MAQNTWPKTVYHYTDRNGMEAIERSGVILPSPNGVYGNGVYFTSLPPEVGRKAVTRNNWAGGWNSLESKGRADYALKMEIPTNKLTTHHGDRNILTHNGPVYLSQYQWTKMHK